MHKQSIFIVVWRLHRYLWQAQSEMLKVYLKDDESVAGFPWWYSNNHWPRLQDSNAMQAYNKIDAFHYYLLCACGCNFFPIVSIKIHVMGIRTPLTSFKAIL